MAITGIDTLDGKQIIAAGASSAISAQQALQTSGGNSLQGLYDFVYNNSGSWTGGGGGGASNALILTGTQCFSSNGGPVCIRINDNEWRWCPTYEQNFNYTIPSENVCTDAMVVVKEITNGYSSFDLSLNLRGVGSPGLQTGTNWGNNAPFYITGYTAAIPVSSPVINYANNNSPCVSGTYTVWSGTELKFYANDYQALASAEQLRAGYTHWEVHGFVS